MNECLQSFYVDLSVFNDIKFNNASFANSMFLTVSSLYFTEISDDLLHVYQCQYDGNKFFNEQSLTAFLSMDNENKSFFENEITQHIKKISNLYVSRQLSGCNLKLINDTIIYVNSDISTCMFTVNHDFDNIIPYINNLTGCALKFSSISSLKLSSNSMSYGDHQFAQVGRGETLLDVNIMNLNGKDYIPESFLEDNYELKSVTLGNVFKTIRKNAFSNCHRLKSIIVPDSVTTIEDGAFQNCYDLEFVELGSDVAHIGENVFYHDSSIKTIVIKNKESVVDLKIDYSVLDFEMKIFVDDSIFESYQEFIGKKYSSNDKYFYYKISELH